MYRILFSERDVDFYEGIENSEEQNKKLDERRRQAIQKILNISGMPGIIAFINSIESPSKAGLALGLIDDNKIDFYLLPAYLDSENKKYKQFLSGFVWNRYQRLGLKWADALDKTSWTLAQKCQLLICLPFEGEIWSLSSAWLGDNESVYWQKVPVNPYQSTSDLLPVVDKLLAVSRPQEAIECLYFRLYKKLPLEKTLTIRALLDAVSIKEPINAPLSQHSIIELIKALQNDPHTNQDDLSRIEWAYLQLLNEFNKAEPKTLAKRLASEPDFFCEMIRKIYRSKHEVKQEEPDDKTEAIANNAWQLLHEWRRPPGLNDDLSFSAEDFETWLSYVKKQCEQSGHLEVAMIKVGEVLFYCPADPNGLWITRVVAKALNAKDAEEMRNGFRTEVYNSRGAYWVDASGKPELELAAQWREKAAAIESEGLARFATTLRELADSYSREAERIKKDHLAEREKNK